MSDTRLRDLERRWKETGTVEDEAAYLVERVRVGDLRQERFELAAYCGHEGARRAIGTRVRPRPRIDTSIRQTPWWTYWAHPFGTTDEDLAWGGGLATFGHDVVVRCAMSLALRLAAERRCDESFEVAVRRGLSAAGEWLACPCERHAQEVVKASFISDSDEVLEGLYPLRPGASRRPVDAAVLAMDSTHERAPLLLCAGSTVAIARQEGVPVIDLVDWALT